MSTDVMPPRPCLSASVNLSITELSRRTGLSVRALKHYEDVGLLGPSRAVGNARIYPGVDLDKIEVIARLRSAGVEVTDLVAAYREPDPSNVKRGLRLAAQNRLRRLASERSILSDFMAETST